MRVNNKAFSLVMGILCLILIIVILSSFLYFSFTKISEKIYKEVPFVAYVEGKILVQYKGAINDQVVMLTHRGGDPVDVRKLTLYVEIIRDGKVEGWFKLWNFPWKRGKWFGTSGIEYLDDRGRTEKDAPNIYIDASNSKKQSWLGELAEDYGDGIWEVGEHIGFRIKKNESRGGIRLKEGDVVKVRLIWNQEVVIIEKDMIVKISK